ncbi:hypothetical protein SEVIR_5G308600v4 [Setaria viridis]|uniref:Uncharacterized protein n=3 Tax=Setaria TaxID=4554 RepID=K3XMY3_SETIT|nr:hypothetical protein SETIT_5G305900v2 [Setaria italica]TKW16580.1 hypothetical protein SEVIR_5G308600v2 [Setaria viridis]
MEGDDILATMDSLWFYSSVLLQPPSKHKQSDCAEELQPRQQQADTHHKTTSSSSDGQAPKSVEEAAVATERRAAAATERRAAARSFCRDREWDERMVAWQKEQRRRTRVAAAARCSQARMPPPGEGVAMKAHLRSWAHAVACSVR